MIKIKRGEFTKYGKLSGYSLSLDKEYNAFTEGKQIEFIDYTETTAQCHFCTIKIINDDNLYLVNKLKIEFIKVKNG